AHKLADATDRTQRYHREGEIPFTSQRKMMSVFCRGDDDRPTLIAKGAPDVLLKHCAAMQVGDEVVPLDDARRERALGA
ncbi:hypothetical protein ABQF26_42155, partial [Mycolicibacterium elephantis]